MKYLYSLLFIFATCSLHAQVVEKSNDTVPSLNGNLELGSQITPDLLESEGYNFDASIAPQVPTFKPLPPLTLSDLNITWDDIDNLEYKGPPTQLSYSRNPYANDYGMYALYGLSPNLYLTTISDRQSQFGVGASTNIGAQLHYKATDWLTISGGPSVTKSNVYDFYNYNSVGFNGSMKFKLNDRFSINTFGQYSFKKGNYGAPQGGMMGTGSQKSYGGALEYRISDKFGIGAGMERELNPFTGKWVNKPIIYPIFY